MTADMLRVIVAVEGVLLLCLDFRSFVYRKITEGMGLGWGCFAFILILLGAVPGLSDWCRVLPKEAYPAFLLLSVSVLLGAFRISCTISQLVRKNREIAMHVSLLNQENERILHEMKELWERENEKKDTVCH